MNGSNAAVVVSTGGRNTLIYGKRWSVGKELADHPRQTMATDVNVYCCDPQSPWQRGSNDSTANLSAFRCIVEIGRDLRLQHSVGKRLDRLV